MASTAAPSVLSRRGKPVTTPPIDPLDALLADNPLAKEFGLGPAAKPLSSRGKPVAARKGDLGTTLPKPLSARGKPVTKPPPSTASMLGEGVVETGKGLASGAISTSGSVLKGASTFSVIDPEIAQQGADLGLYPIDPNRPIEEQISTGRPQDTALFKGGEAMQDFAADRLGPGPGWEDSWTRSISQAFGSTAPFLVAGLAGPASLPIGTIAGVWAGAGEAMDRAIESGATQEQIMQAARLGNIPGATEQLPIEVLFERVPLPAMGRFAGVLGRVFTKAAAEGGQEGLQQAAQNLIERYVYNPEQDIAEGVAEAAGLGAIVGGGIGAATEPFRRQAAPPVAAEQPQPAPQQAPQAAPPLTGDILPPEPQAAPASSQGDLQHPILDLQANVPPAQAAPQGVMPTPPAALGFPPAEPPSAVAVGGGRAAITRPGAAVEEEVRESLAAGHMDATGGQSALDAAIAGVQDEINTGGTHAPNGAPWADVLAALQQQGKPRPPLAVPVGQPVEALAPMRRRPATVPSDIRPPKENLHTLLGANFEHGNVVGPQIEKMSRLTGGTSIGDDPARVARLAEQISGPDGYFERIVVDDTGRVVEGQHRLEALRKLGVEDVPIMRVRDKTQNLDTFRMKQAMQDAGKIHPDHVHQIMGQVIDMLDEVKGDPQAVLREFEFPRGYEKFFKAALKAAPIPQRRGKKGSLAKTDKLPNSTIIAAGDKGGAVQQGRIPTLPEFMRERFGPEWAITRRRDISNRITRKQYKEAKSDYEKLIGAPAYSDEHLAMMRAQEGAASKKVDLSSRGRPVETGADGKPQLVIPGTEKASDATLAQRKADAPLKPKAEQKSMESGLFGDSAKQTTFLKPPTRARKSQKLSRPEIENAVIDIVTRMSAASDLALPEKVVVTDQRALRQSGYSGTWASISGSYNYTTGLISIAMASKDDVRSTAIHESWHSLEELLTKNEIALLRREKDRLHEVAVHYLGWDSTAHMKADGVNLATREIWATAAEAYIFNNKVRGIHVAVRRIFDRLARIIREVRNWLQGNGFQTAEDVFDEAWAGEIKARGEVQKRPPTQEEALQPAWHGSPHRFTKFMLDKIGTGEGAQTYGWGLYFASKKEVAEFYRKKLTQHDDDTVTANSVARQFLQEADGDYEVAIKAVERFRDLGGRLGWRNGGRAWPEGKGAHDLLMRRAVDLRKPGALYRVEIPEDDTFLLWDKPLSEQPEKVKTALAKLGIGVKRGMAGEAGSDNVFSANLAEIEFAEMHGEEAYIKLAKAKGGERTLGSGATAWQVPYTNEQAASLALHEAGVSGIKYLAGTSRAAGEGDFNYVVFDDAAIEIVEALAPRRRPRADPNAAFDVPNTPARIRKFLTSVSFNRFGASFPTERDLRFNLQDRMIDMRETQKAIAEQLGGPLPGEYDVYQAEELYHGKTGARLFKLRREHIRPLTAAMRSRKVSGYELGQFLMARHAPERNADLTARGSMLAAPSGVSNREAAQIIARLSRGGRRADFDYLARMVDGIIADARDALLGSGLISAEQHADWSTRYQHYVPLRGWENDPESEQEMARIGRGFDVRGPEAKQATGRASRADNPLIYAIMQAEQAIVRAEKNRVLNTLRRLVETFPNKAIWEVNRIEQKTRINKDTGMLETYSVGPADFFSDNVFVAKREGVSTFITIHDPKLARDMKMLGAEGLRSFLRLTGWINRTLSKLHTSLNPAFTIPNFFRDATSGLLHLSEYTQRAPGLRRKVLRDIPRAMGAMGRYLAGKDAGRWTGYAKEFAEAGGKIEFFNIDSVGEQQRKIEADLKAGKMRNAFRGLVDGIEIANGAVENAIRLATYVNLRRAGASKAEAASAARNLTVNFNRKGAWGPTVNSLYMFFNAAVQGNVRMAQALRRSKVVRRAAVAMILSGAVQDIVNYLVSGDDDDDMNRWDKLPSWEKERNYVIWLPGQKGAIKIPLPYGYNVAPVIGNQVSAMVRKMIGLGKGVEPTEAALNIASALFGSFMPISAGSTISQTISPTVSDPFVEIIQNQDWSGRRVHPENFDPKKIPDSTLAFRSTSAFSKKLAQALNSLSKGNEFKPGWLDYSPNDIDHLVEFFIGGAGDFWYDKIATNLWRLATGEEIESYQVPFRSKVYTEVGTFTDQNVYYDLQERVESVKVQRKGFNESGQADRAKKVMRDNPVEAEVIGAFDASEKKLRALRKQQRAMEARGLPREKELAERNRIRGEMDKVMLEARKVWEAARREQAN